jgi:hypothetical protein
MPIHPAGIVQDLSAANATAFNRIELNGVAVQNIVTEVGISMNGAPNSTLTPVQFQLQRMSTVGTGSAGTVVKLAGGYTPSMTALVENSADGTLVDSCHTWFVPVVSGVIWVAAPGREIDFTAAQFMGLKNIAALGASINAACYLVFEE